MNGKNIDFTFDTGADVSTLTEKDCEKLGLQLKVPERCLAGADGSRLKVLGIADVSIKSKDKAINAPVYVLKRSKRNLLGISELKQLNLLSFVNTVCAGTDLNRGHDSKLNPVRKRAMVDVKPDGKNEAKSSGIVHFPRESDTSENTHVEQVQSLFRFESSKGFMNKVNSCLQKGSEISGENLATKGQSFKDRRKMLWNSYLLDLARIDQQEFEMLKAKVHTGHPTVSGLSLEKTDPAYPDCWIRHCHHPPWSEELNAAQKPRSVMFPTEASVPADAPRPVSGEELPNEAHRDSERVGSGSEESVGSNLGLAGMLWADRADLEDQLLAGESQSVGQLPAGEGQQEERLLAGVDQQEFGHSRAPDEKMKEGEVVDEKKVLGVALHVCSTLIR